MLLLYQLVWNDANTYVNGSADYSRTEEIQVRRNSTDDFRIARNWDNDQSGTMLIIGRIDDVRYYNRLLSGNDIAELYAYRTSYDSKPPPTHHLHPPQSGNTASGISDKAIDITDSSATVAWTTDEAHGEYIMAQTPLTDIKTDWTPTKEDHSIKLENFQPKATYHYK